MASCSNSGNSGKAEVGSSGVNQELVAPPATGLSAFAFQREGFNVSAVESVKFEGVMLTATGEEPHEKFPRAEITFRADKTGHSR